MHIALEVGKLQRSIGFYRELRSAKKRDRLAPQEFERLLQRGRLRVTCKCSARESC